MNRPRNASESADQHDQAKEPNSLDNQVDIVTVQNDESPTNTNNILNNKLGGKKSEKLDVFDGIVESSSGKEDCAKIPSDKSENVNSTTKVGIVKNSTEKQQEKKANNSEKSEISSSSDNLPSPNTVLPDIVNVQPNVISTATDTDDSLIQSLTSNLTGLQIGTPKGNQPLPDSPAIRTNLTNFLAPSNDALSAVSSDDEVFSECQTFNEANAMESNDMNQSTSWENVVSSVTSGCADSLDNTQEQIEPSAIDSQSDLLAKPNTVETTVTSALCDSIDTSNEANVQSNVSGDLKSIDNPEMKVDTTCPQDADYSSHTQNIEITNEKCDPENSGPNVLQIPQIKIEPGTPTLSPQRENLDGTFNATEQNILDPIKKEPPASPKTELNTTFQSTPNKSPNTTVEIKQSSPTPTDTTFVANLNETVSVDNTPEDFITKVKKDKCNENELKAAFAVSPKAPEPMDIDDTWSEGASTVLNSTQVIGKANTPAKTSPKRQDVFIENLITDKIDVTFKAPTGPAPHANNKRRSQEKNDIGDEEFSSNGISVILTPSDFDFLLSKGHSVPVNQQQQSQPPQKQRSPPFPGSNKSLNNTRNLSHFESSLNTTHEEGDIQPNNFLHDQFVLEASCDSSRGSLNCTVPVGGGDELSFHSVNGLDKTLSGTSVNKSLNFHENQKLLKDRINRSQPEEKKSNAKMSVDVIQDMKIENDTKCIDNINSQTDEKQEYNMAELEKKIKNETLKTEDVEKKLKEAEQREEALLKRIAEKDRTISKMSGVLEQYEKAIAELIAEKEQIKQNCEKQLAEIKADRDLNYQHLTSLETTFSDLHAKYERSKQVAATLKSNEEALLAEKKQNLENLRLQEQRYDKMKNHAMQQIEIANNKLETLVKNHSIEITKLKALLKKEEISRLSMNEQLIQKTRENEELMKICDELINGQGTS
ncbi:unnamed protein product [Hermetia illucens]|uniref:Transforming acidic coiled-coil-containing protein C-terminal domain-containing protein n=1 Tax=Hermetia illucens TaxID=343691 RepID=A0A7R8V5W1_HERIL|nr:unnamed protein product [Hermetia illucens]